MSEAKDKFIDSLISKLNYENSTRLMRNVELIDVCYIVSIIDQEIENYDVFIKDITEHKYDIYAHIEPSCYTNGDCSIDIENKSYYYKIEFLYEDKFLGYCQCSPENPLYNKMHKCTGINCDWDAPKFNITKIEFLGSAVWNKVQREYWQYEENFKQKESNIVKEIEDYEKQKKIDRLKRIIKNSQEELNELEN